MDTTDTHHDEHDAYWRENHAQQPFATEGTYEEYSPAYRAGYAGYGAHERKDVGFEEAEAQLREYFETYSATSGNGADAETHLKGHRRLTWEAARPAARAAWNRAQSTGRAAGL